MSRSEVQLLTDDLVEAVVEQARHSPRRRMNYNFHAGNEDNPHRFLNVFLEGSYVQPHRHKSAPKAESFIVLRGHMVAMVFDDSGAVVSGHILGPGPYVGRVPVRVGSGVVAHGIDLAPGLWHTVAALTPVAVCYEVKPGPWDAATDKEMAPWAPAEGSPDAAEYLRALLA
jgi:cupin fold WbuC family metalloprotein